MKQVVSFLAFASALSTVQSFAVLQNQVRTAAEPSSSFLMMAPRGMGMGMATAAPSKKNGMGGGNKKKGKKGGKASSSSPPFDVSASILRLEKKYDQLMLAYNKQVAKDDKSEKEEPESIWDEDVQKPPSKDTPNNTIFKEPVAEVRTSEYVVAARSASGKAAVSDWVPIAQICLSRDSNTEFEGNEVTGAAVSSYCRELYHVASLGAPVFATVPRNQIQYSVEPVDEFFKHVYEAVMGSVSGSEKPSDESMSKAEARKALELADDVVDKGAIKTAYRKLAFELHSDRFEGTEEECAEAAERFSAIKVAYEALSSGVREEGASWYQSLGGRSRTSFVGPIPLQNIDASKQFLISSEVQSAVVGLDREMVQSFVTRNLRSQ